MKVTSQVRSPTWVAPTFCLAKAVTGIHLSPLEADPAARGDGHRRVMERIGERLEAMAGLSAFAD